jgi:hypothetical protein
MSFCGVCNSAQTIAIFELNDSMLLNLFFLISVAKFVVVLFSEKKVGRRKKLTAE